MDGKLVTLNPEVSGAYNIPFRALLKADEATCCENTYDLRVVECPDAPGILGGLVPHVDGIDLKAYP